MILNFDLVSLQSLSGMQYFGEFDDVNKMIAELEKLRQSNKLNAIDHTILMIAFIKTKKVGVYKLSYLSGQWVLRLQ